MATATAIPGRYAKFITALAAELIAYLSLYGTTWHLDPALLAIGTALAVFGVPNATQSPVVPPVTPAAPVASLVERFNDPALTGTDKGPSGEPPTPAHRL